MEVAKDMLLRGFVLLQDGKRGKDVNVFVCETGTRVKELAVANCVAWMDHEKTTYR
jgi:hypothetical protein